MLLNIFLIRVINLCLKSLRIENKCSQFRGMTTAILKYANCKLKGHLPECQNCTKN